MNKMENRNAGSDFESIDGLLVIDKPAGPSTYDCIRFLRKTCDIPRFVKIGHLGTLDPFASGVVVIAFGKAVRYAQFGIHSNKTYRARLWLGEETETLDPTGRVIISKPVPSDWAQHLPEIRSKFIGTSEQVPPLFSAKQVKGQRAYNAARKGRVIELKSVRIVVHSLEFTDHTDNWVDFTCEVSGGTYIRALGRDIAAALGTVGHLVGLERISSGPFTNDMSIPFAAFEVGGIKVVRHHLRPVDMILSHLPAITVKNEVFNKVINGIGLKPDDIIQQLDDNLFQNEFVRILSENNYFLALGKINSKSRRIIPVKQWGI